MVEEREGEGRRGVVQCGAAQCVSVFGAVGVLDAIFRLVGSRLGARSTAGMDRGGEDAGSGAASQGRRAGELSSAQLSRGAKK